jgi:hypothetical protein
MLTGSGNVTETERWLGIEIETETGGTAKKMMTDIGLGNLLQIITTAITAPNTQRQRNIVGQEGMNGKSPIETRQIEESVDEMIEHMITTEIPTAVVD